MAAARSVGRIVFARAFPSFGVDYQLAFRQELVHHLDGSSHVAARVSAQVDDDSLAALLVQLGQGNQHFGIGRFTEFLDVDVAILVIDHVSRLDGLVGNVVADDGEVQQFLLALTEDAQFHFTALGTFQTFHRFVVGHDFAHESRVVYFHDAVAWHDAHLFRRASGNDIADVDGVLLDGELHPDTAEASSQVIVHGLKVLGGDVRGVWVQFS